MPQVLALMGFVSQSSSQGSGESETMTGVSPAPPTVAARGAVGQFDNPRGKSIFVFSSIHVKIICMEKLACGV